MRQLKLRRLGVAHRLLRGSPGMAPKRSAAKPKPKAKAKNAPKAEAVGESLIDVADGRRAGRGREPVRRRTTEQDAEKTVREKFGSIDERERRMTYDSEGMNIYDRVLQALVAC